VIHDGRVFLVNDNDEQSFAVALDAKTGRQLWRVERDEKSNWATPYIWQNELRTELIASGTQRVRSYDLGGKLLWELGGMSSALLLSGDQVRSRILQPRPVAILNGPFIK
jgi:outer membrane protein assembly factor BamB